MIGEVEALKNDILDLASSDVAARRFEARRAFASLREALNAGRVRAAEKVDGRWIVNEWVRQGILMGFKVGENRPAPETGVVQARDRDTLPLLSPERFDPRTRLVPGGSSIRDGVFIGRGVVCMPPMYINIGAYVDDETMIDSHALVGSCAQIGKRCHVSAGAQIGGVLEPPGAWPVIIEDGALVGAGVCVVEGVIVEAGAVLGAGVTLTASTPVYDLVRETIHRASSGAPLTIPAGAVVVPGSRPARGAFAQAQGLHVATPLIVKYKDQKNSSDFLEASLR
ncbi:MAG: 2,3,4,5-tetrahydropyridine-2,6-dicarboxylate N-succinyltransferase [Candidatus Sumerlaeota bacterium]|nr:2,3,4,5-tetrahydropyridine-2,6-dicarboxylate N-succinyltransferase [Candidatus Sumerlaeota bacterium]